MAVKQPIYGYVKELSSINEDLENIGLSIKDQKYALKTDLTFKNREIYTEDDPYRGMKGNSLHSIEQEGETWSERFPFHPLKPEIGQEFYRRSFFKTDPNSQFPKGITVFSTLNQNKNKKGGNIDYSIYHGKVNHPRSSKPTYSETIPLTISNKQYHDDHSAILQSLGIGKLKPTMESVESYSSNDDEWQREEPIQKKQKNIELTPDNTPQELRSIYERIPYGTDQDTLNSVSDIISHKNISAGLIHKIVRDRIPQIQDYYQTPETVRAPYSIHPENDKGLSFTVAYHAANNKKTHPQTLFDLSHAEDFAGIHRNLIEHPRISPEALDNLAKNKYNHPDILRRRLVNPETIQKIIDNNRDNEDFYLTAVAHPNAPEKEVLNSRNKYSDLQSDQYRSLGLTADFPNKGDLGIRRRRIDKDLQNIANKRKKGGKISWEDTSRYARGYRNQYDYRQTESTNDNQWKMLDTLSLIEMTLSGNVGGFAMPFAGTPLRNAPFNGPRKKKKHNKK